MITKPKQFVVFEGMDCAGKSSIIKMLQSYIEKLDNKEQYIFTREPGSSNSKEAEKIRTLILDKENEFSPTSDALLFLAARRINLEKVIWPALENNKIIFSDRYWYSSFVYQGILGNVGYDKIRQINELMSNNTSPDLVIFFDLTPELVIKRLKHMRSETDRLEHNEINYYERLREAYKQVIKHDKDKFVIVDSSGSLNDLFNEIIKILKDWNIV